MAALIPTMILMFSALCGSAVVAGVLQGPRNVRITSYNMDLVLKWDPPENTTSGLVYRAEYISSVVSDYKVGCVNTTAHRCEFTGLGITVYGQYTGRVRAELGEEMSAWVESTEIMMDKNTTIGPPSVSLISNGVNIEVSVIDPVFRISALRRAYNYATYNITYWKEGQEEKAASISGIQQNRVVLNELRPWTRYCVRVQINTEMNPTPSQPSNVTCESTASEEKVPWVAAVVTFLVMAVVVTLTVVAAVHRKELSHFFCPKDSLPQHFKECLLQPPTSTIYLAMRNSHPPEEVYHQVSIIPDGRAVEEERPLEEGGTNCNRQPEPLVGGGG